MNDKLLPPKLHDFLEEKMRCPTHRKIFHVGLALAKVSLMYQQLPGEAIPDEAKASVLLLLEGLESGDAAEYAACDAHVTTLYREWLTTREVH